MKKQDLSVLKSMILREMQGGMCNECGGAMYEGMCTECGWMEENQRPIVGMKEGVRLSSDDTDDLNDILTSEAGLDLYDVEPIVGELELMGLDLDKADIDDEIKEKLRNSEKFKALQAKYSEDQSGIEENHEGQDHEVSMANNSLDSIEWAVGELKRQLGDQERDIPAWIQDHITNAENYILQAAKNFHDYGQEEQGEAPEAEYGDEEAQDMSLSSLMEAKKKPSAGLSKKQKSAIAKKARKGGDIGKKGRGFEKVEKAAKKSGADNPKAVAAAAMWKAAAKRAKK